MVSFTSQTRPLRREASQQRQTERILAVISHPLAVPDTRRRRILSSLLSIIQHDDPHPGTHSIVLKEYSRPQNNFSNLESF